MQGTAQQRVVLLPPPRPGSSPHPPGSIQLFAHAPPMSARSRAFQALLVNLVGGGGVSGGRVREVRVLHKAFLVNFTGSGGHVS